MLLLQLLKCEELYGFIIGLGSQHYRNVYMYILYIKKND